MHFQHLQNQLQQNGDSLNAYSSRNCNQLYKCISVT